ncbi:MinD/ParA family ATP-binding protein [Halorubrum kocurii]|uniref:Cell division inhibitor minD n=1 Tax=Halorubrum kocurii JCM 14978 TaxID=1230456 RepID=M0PK99_9EURY|nr:hypothetical protein [Halorubrum kocurii]EMA70024.1 Cell division inhibitor minD [Halorubrum kocurii JCM 14978]
MNHTVAVTGETQGEGKATSVAIPGGVFAETGADVLLVDCDFTNPSLAVDIGIRDPETTVYDVCTGSATVREAVHTGLAGIAVVPGKRFSVPDAADGVVVVSRSGGAAGRNAAAVHGSLREHGRPPLGTAITRVESNADSTDWDCELLATVPESNAVAVGATAVLDALSDPAAGSCRELAQGVYRRLRNENDETVSNTVTWLPQLSDLFVAAAVTDGASGDTDTSSIDEAGEPKSAASADGAHSTVTAVTDGGTDSEGVADDSTAEANGSTEGPTEDDDNGPTITRRGALAALTVAVGGVSAGILNTHETPKIEAFGYGGTPVSSTESGATSATNNTTNAGSLPTAGVAQTEPTDETGTEGTEEDPIGNETETGNTTAPENVSNTTETGEDLAPDAEPAPDEDSETEAPPTNGGGGGSTGSGSDTGGGGGAGGDDGTTDEPPEPRQGEFGTVGYGSGGYGGVA